MFNKALQRQLFVLILLVLALTLVLACWDVQHFWNTPERASSNIWHLFEYWGCWVLWPTLLYCCVGLKLAGRVRQRVGYCTVLCICCCLIWGRFIEPNLLTIKRTNLSMGCNVRVALISDIHAGLFEREQQLNRLVSTLNAMDVDAVLVAGDWTYESRPNLNNVLSAFRRLRHPIYAVLGNHDKEQPGPPLAQQLQQSMESMGAHLIEGRSITLGQCQLTGLGDNWAGDDVRDLRLIERTGKPRVVLTHNPDTAEILPVGFAQLVLAGHTHGGQIRLPWLTAIVLKTATLRGFDHGLYVLSNTRLFITAGTGRIGMPFRFANPPVIDVLEL